MRPERRSETLLATTRSKAKMIEFGIPEQFHIEIPQDPARLLALAIGILGDLTAETNRHCRLSDEVAELRQTLRFSAWFFDAYFQSGLNQALDDYLILLGSASYYLCGFPGSSRVLASRIAEPSLDLHSEGLENLLLWLLRADSSLPNSLLGGPYAASIISICETITRFRQTGEHGEAMLEQSRQLRSDVYRFGTPRELLLGDTIAAVISAKHENSPWTTLPEYSGLPRERWSHAIREATFIDELWPAQHLIGRHGVLQGRSAVIQMPTSAGKTKAVELVLRSAFLANRVTLAVIVTPFRALCHEIRDSLAAALSTDGIAVDEFSDALQRDFQAEDLLENRRVLVVTPEKLSYVIRHSPELVSGIGLIVFDEAHQFDTGYRGVTYELLLTSLRSALPVDTQKLLISAVIPNAEAIGDWLYADRGETVSGSDLIPTFKSVGFTSWVDRLGRIEYVSDEDPDETEFFVPRVVQSRELQLRGRERRPRVFPDKSDPKSVALYLGLKLVGKGSVAIFCGRKDAASGLVEMAVDAVSRGLELPLASDSSDASEIQKLVNLHCRNLGDDAPSTMSARIGVFPHHGNTPRGIRIAIEHAMRESLIRLVVCTSTLAQGVNLPIRYLVVTGVYQGGSQIKVRDFHNLMGRVGRAGMHTEGSVIFADPGLFDGRAGWRGKWRWEQVKRLLRPGNSEPCASTLLTLLEPVRSNDGDFVLRMDPLEFIRDCLIDPSAIAKLPEDIQDRFSIDVERRLNLLSSLESFLLSYGDAENRAPEDTAEILAEQTLAFFLSDKEKKTRLRELFRLVAENIASNCESTRKRLYGGTLYGLREARQIDEWVNRNVEGLLTADTQEAMLDVIWPLLAAHVHSGAFRKCDSPAALREMTAEWLGGRPFFELLEILRTHDAAIPWGRRGRRRLDIDDVVGLCEGALAFEGAMLIGAVIEFVGAADAQDENVDLVRRLSSFQKKLKYGLPTERAITVYELGFCDRVIAQELAVTLDGVDRLSVMHQLRSSRQVERLLDRYPTYYTAEVLANLT